MNISLCLLTLNEKYGCEIDLPNIPYSLFSQVFAIDGNSTDGTVELLKKYGISVITQQSAQYNGAYIDAFKEFSGDAIIFYHPKGTIDPIYLENMVKYLDKNYDIVIASRMLKDSKNEEDKFYFRPRKVFGKLLGLCSWFIWGGARSFKLRYVSDPLHGFRGLSSRFVTTLNLKNSDVTADLEMIRHLYRSNYNFQLQEFPVQESIRIFGVSHFPALRTGKKLIKYLLFGK